jgi:hypothetical protein
MNIHEEQFAANFIMPVKQERYLSLLKSAKGRSKLRFGLNYCSDLDMRYAKLVSADQQCADALFKILKQKGAPDLCYVMSSNSNLDEEELSLYRALERTIGFGMGTLISCIPGKLAYFEFEEPGERYILEHK